jgi:hypothetical protein
MAEHEYQKIEAWNTAIRLATAIGRLKVGSNLKAAATAHERAFELAALAAALIADGSGREGGGQAGLYRDARGALAQSRSWLHVLAATMNEQDSVFGNELDLAEQASRQLGAMLRSAERPPVAGPRPPLRGGPPPPGPRPGGPASAGARPQGPPRGNRGGP